jgi:hypothetical protein
MNSELTEKVQIVPGFAPVDLSAAHASDYVSLKNYGRVSCKFVAGVGTAGDDPTITLAQAQNVAGTGSKGAAFTKIKVKKASAISAVGTFTDVTQASGSTYTDTASAENEKMWVIDVKAEDLDVANGFDCVQLGVSTTTTAGQVGYVEYELHEPRYNNGGVLPSAIID